MALHQLQRAQFNFNYFLIQTIPSRVLDAASVLQSNVVQTSNSIKISKPICASFWAKTHFKPKTDYRRSKLSISFLMQYYLYFTLTQKQKQMRHSQHHKPLKEKNWLKTSAIKNLQREKLPVLRTSRAHNARKRLKMVEFCIRLAATISPHLQHCWEQENLRENRNSVATGERMETTKRARAHVTTCNVAAASKLGNR